MTDHAEEGHNARVSGRRRFATKSSRAILALVLVGIAGVGFLILGGGGDGVEDIMIERVPDPADDQRRP